MKNLKIFYLATVVIGIGLMNSCTKDSGPLYLTPEVIVPPIDTTDTTTIDTTFIPTVSFSTDVTPIFTEHCVACHPPTVELDLQAANAYDQIVNIVSGSYAPGILVVPFEPESSVLYLKMINNGEFGIGMPPPSGGVPEYQLDIIETWILEGALDN